MTKNEIREENLFLRIRCFLLSMVLEAAVSIYFTVTIQADPKNAFLLGLSLVRWIIVVATLLVSSALIFLVVKPTYLIQLDEKLSNSLKAIRVVDWLGIAACLLFWATIWIDTNQTVSFQAEFIRLKPFLIWVELVIIQLFIYLNRKTVISNLKELLEHVRKNKFFTWLFTGFACLLVIIFILLRYFTVIREGFQYYLTPAATLSSLQVFFSFIFFILVFSLTTGRNEKFFQKRVWVAVSFFLIWIFTFILWNSVTLNCIDDRIGPFPPNNICYPIINDAVYTTGAHYITLGRGIYNHWFTDKPGYMLFLALGQWVFGTAINQYLIFQIIVISLVPALLFLLGRKMTNFAGGIFLASISTMLGYNNISLYESVGGVNVNFENPELLTSLLLILLCLALFNWWRDKANHRWAALTGAILGLTTLVRINPIFIVPIIFIGSVLLFRKNFKSMISNLLIFLLGFCLVVTPWVLSANDPSGTNFYLSKMQMVLKGRYINPQKTTITPKTDNSNLLFTPTIKPRKTKTPTPQPTSTPAKNGVVPNGRMTSSLVNLLPDNSFVVNEIQSPIFQATPTPESSILYIKNVRSLPITPTPTIKPKKGKTPTPTLTLGNPLLTTINSDDTKDRRIVKGERVEILYHFINNEYLPLLKLPTILTFMPLSKVVKQPLWDFEQTVPFWKFKLSPENIIAVSLNGLLVLFGIFYAVKKFGAAGITPLLIQVGYHFGNGFALTSGDRYLEPVAWVTLLYYAVGVCLLASLLFNAFRHKKEDQNLTNKTDELQNTIKQSKQKWFTLGILGITLLVGLAFPLTSHLKDQLPVETSPDLKNRTYTFLSAVGKISSWKWNSFLNDPNSLVIEGVAFQPRIYNSPMFLPTKTSLEIMVLAQNNVYISYSTGISSIDPIKDGSRVILVGCQLANDVKWGAKRIIGESFAIILLDDANKIISEPSAVWKCTK